MIVNIPNQNDPSENRQALHAYLTDPARLAWLSFAEDNGVSVTGLLEALGILLANDIDENGGDPDIPKHKAWIKLGRKIDGLRRRRSR